MFLNIRLLFHQLGGPGRRIKTLGTSNFHDNLVSRGSLLPRGTGNEVAFLSFLGVYKPVKGAVPASVQSATNCTGTSVTGDSSTPGPDTLTLLASKGGPARTRNGLLGTCLSPYFTLMV